MALLAYSVQFHPAGNDAWDPARGQSYWTVSELFHELDGYVETQGDYTLQLRMAAMIGALHCDVAPTTCPTTPSSVPSPDESTCLPTSAPMVSSPASTDYYSSPPSELEFWLESTDSEISKSTTTLFPDDFTSDIFTRATPPVEEYFQHFYDENSLESASSTASSSIDDFTSLPSTASFDIWDDLLACDLPIPDLLSASSSSSISTSSDSIWNLSLPSSPSSIGWTANETSAVPAPRWSQPKANRSKPAPQGQPSRPLPSVPLWSHSKRKRPAPQGQRTRKAKGENKGGDKPPRKRQRKDLKDLKWLPLNTASAAGKENP
ncbi:hypothetical protein FB45DRAFT_101067 [Roridomyces roridus]|uniref:Uncharacterized protein n=1 Tax=Roridomyces roridus TaxID=1738132 RepID=A0AAD7BJP8_9AGAR|nr:hypothetical protein FB45DRAFT_101067 [Roridomyces roridus]